jgi:DNA-binding CsgD family transcriptional regulator
VSETAVYPTCTCGCGKPGDEAHGLCNTAYQRWRRRQIAYGRWQARVPVDAARAHVKHLRDAGLSTPQIAELAGTNRGTIRNIGLPETSSITADVERAVLAVPVPDRPRDVVADNALVSIVGARRRIQALIAHGYPQAYLARELGVASNHAVMAAFVERRLPRTSVGRRITAGRDRRVKAMFDRLQMTPGPSQNARNYGRKRGWALPFEWDEESIDDPRGAPTRARYRRESTEGDRSERDAKAAERRKRVAELTDAGLSAGQIAVRLGISQRTVVRDRGHIPGWEKAS